MVAITAAGGFGSYSIRGLDEKSQSPAHANGAMKPTQRRVSASAEVGSQPIGLPRQRRRARSIPLYSVVRMNTSCSLQRSRLRLVLSIGGSGAARGRSRRVEEWYERGVRSAGLTWNHPNEFAGGIDTPTQGLTERGRTLVRRFAELGVVLDLAHASEQTWRYVLREQVPFSVTHAGCRAVCDHPRNLADWQLQALAACGGVLGMMAIPFVVDREAPTLRRWLDHSTTPSR